MEMDSEIRVRCAVGTTGAFKVEVGLSPRISTEPVSLRFGDGSGDEGCHTAGALV